MTALFVILLIPTVAHAHVGVGDTQGLLHGFHHPLAGLDHILAMLAVGLWAAQRGGRSLWMIPAAFVSMMALAGLLGSGGLSIPFVEEGILTSVFALGVLIAAACRLPMGLSVFLVGLFAVFHGHAHGSEMAPDTSGLAYGVGFVVATALLHITGLGIAAWMNRAGEGRMIRFAGGMIALSGIYLWLIA